MLRQREGTSLEAVLTSLSVLPACRNGIKKPLEHKYTSRKGVSGGGEGGTAGTSTCCVRLRLRRRLAAAGGGGSSSGWRRREGGLLTGNVSGLQLAAAGSGHAAYGWSGSRRRRRVAGCACCLRLAGTGRARWRLEQQRRRPERPGTAACGPRHPADQRHTAAAAAARQGGTQRRSALTCVALRLWQPQYCRSAQATKPEACRCYTNNIQGHGACSAATRMWHCSSIERVDERHM